MSGSLNSGLQLNQSLPALQLNSPTGPLEMATKVQELKNMISTNAQIQAQTRNADADLQTKQQTLTEQRTDRFNQLVGSVIALPNSQLDGGQAAYDAVDKALASTDITQQDAAAWKAAHPLGQPASAYRTSLGLGVVQRANPELAAKLLTPQTNLQNVGGTNVPVTNPAPASSLVAGQAQPLQVNGQPIGGLNQTPTPGENLQRTGTWQYDPATKSYIQVQVPTTSITPNITNNPIVPLQQQGKITPLSASPETAALGNAVASSEGADYTTKFGEKPGQGTLDLNGPHPVEGAAGKYQFMPQTWKDGIQALGLPDKMTPQNQEAVYHWLLARRGITQDQLSDPKNLPQVISQLREEWPSLPGGNQQRKGSTIGSVGSDYLRGLPTQAPAAPVASSPSATPASTQLPSPAVQPPPPSAAPGYVGGVPGATLAAPPPGANVPAEASANQYADARTNDQKYATSLETLNHTIALQNDTTTGGGAQRVNSVRNFLSTNASRFGLDVGKIDTASADELGKMYYEAVNQKSIGMTDARLNVIGQANPSMDKSAMANQDLNLRNKMLLNYDHAAYTAANAAGIPPAGYADFIQTWKAHNNPIAYYDFPSRDAAKGAIGRMGTDEKAQFWQSMAAKQKLLGQIATQGTPTPNQAQGQ